KRASWSTDAARDHSSGAIPAHAGDPAPSPVFCFAAASESGRMMSSVSIRFLAGALLAAGITAAGPAAAERPTFDTTARNAIVVDFQTGAVLLDKNADQRIPTASMSKIMTAYTVYGYLVDGKAKLDDMLPVSEAAWRTGGSKMFVPYPG